MKKFAPLTMRALKKYILLLRYARPHARWLLSIVLISILMSATVALQPWPLKILVDYALGSGEPPELLTSFLIIFTQEFNPSALIVAAAIASLALFFLNSIFNVALTAIWALVGQRMIYQLSADIFYHLLRTSLLSHNQRTTGDSLNRLTGDNWCVYTVVESLLVAPVQYFFTLLTVTWVAWQMNPELTLIALSVAPVMAIIAVYFGRRIKMFEKQNRQVKSKLMTFVHQTLSVIPVVQAFAAENRNQYQFNKLSAKAVTATQQNVLTKNTFSMISGLISTIGTAVVIYAGGQYVLSNTLSIGSLLVFIAYLKSIQGAFQGIIRTYGNLKAAEASIDRVFEIIETPKMKEGQQAHINPSRRFEQTIQSIKFENINFSYEINKPILKNISLNIKFGETIAIVGQTGAGKTTLVSLLPRFFEPSSGRILINDINIREFNITDLRKSIALVSQQPYLLPVSIAENIAYGSPKASTNEIVAAAKLAQVDEFVRLLPQGYETVISERGANLSGGQKQRIAIARAILKDAPILILDEPTAALDLHSEALIIEALEQLSKGRTTFIIAHRLSTIQRADRVIVMAEGQIIESGSHTELIAHRGSYSRFYSSQIPVGVQV
jgi:ATP-binding cassette subfamily B protein/subfamily B ATP-binding cassette protein MsbA